MLKKYFRFLFSTFVVGALLGSVMSVAFAATATSSPKSYGPILGYSYVSSATISNDTNLYGLARVERSTTATVPTGYMGVKARVYKSTGICLESGTSYNSSATNGQGVTTTIGAPDCGSGTYYGKGQTEAYNGNGYDVYNTNQTPNINH